LSAINGYNHIFFGNAADANVGVLLYDHTNNSMQFQVNASERMRIDSSGNLLVNKTSIGTATVGVEARANGLLQATRDGGNALELNRKTSDGTIIDLRKDGTSIGNIGIASSTNDLFINSVASNHKGLRFGSGAIVPINNSGSTDDGTTTLGGATQRFNNLFLAGGVYVGGTGSANYLDDYEEGTVGNVTMTPIDSGSITLDTSHNTLSYVKIGRLVVINGMLRISSVSSPVGIYFTIDGLPFAVRNLDESAGRAQGGIMIKDDSVSGANAYEMEGSLLIEATTKIRIYRSAADLGATDDIYVSCSYFS